MTRRFLQALPWLCLLFAMQAHAFLREIDPSGEVKLAADEGLLLVSVDTLTPIHYVRVQREGSIFTYAKLPDLNAGVTTKLYAAPAGKYRWDRVGLSDEYYYELSDDAELKFEIKAGVVNYPGDLLFRRARGTSSRLRMTDRALRALDWLENTYPALWSLRFVYVGHYPDPFPDFYRKARAMLAGTTPGGLDKTVELPKPVALPLPVEDLWQPGRIGTLALNPAGDLLAEAVYEKGKWGIDLIDLHASDARRLVNPPFPIESMRWFGNRTLVASMGGDNEPNFIAIFQVDDHGPKGRSITNINLPYTGRIVGGIASDPTQLLVASLSPHGQAMVHRVDISSQASIKNSRHDYESRLNKGLKDDYAWFADGSGQIRAALASAGSQVVLLYGGNGEFHELLRYTSGSESEFWPNRLSPRGDLIYGSTEWGRGQRDFVAFDPATKTITKTLFSKPGVDVEGALFNRTGEPIGATYYDAGHLVNRYFDAANNHMNALVEKAFPDKSAVMLTRDEDGKVGILGVDGSDFPYALYQLDVDRHRAALIDQDVPALSKRKWMPSVVIHAKGADGLGIEAYLTLPASNGKLPLVVLAHGGPIGVRDERHFDPEVQFLATLGYAVLQVNFRGSEGYGNSYRKAGMGSYGTLIEDDIDSALDAALAKYPLDANRMCTMGTSYGGYSALMSAVRHPDRFRCVISISGPTDRTLSFTASDSAYAASGRKALEKYIGDPGAHPGELLRISPIYRAGEIKAPLLLIHGTEDERVDYENARRLVRMLNIAGRPPSLIRLEGEGHGVRAMKNRLVAFPAIAAFLSEHLKGEGSPASSAAH